MKGFCALVVACVCLCALGGFRTARAQEGFHPQDIPRQEHCHENYRDSDRPREWTDGACAPSPHRCDRDCASPSEHREAGCCTRCEQREGSGADCRDRPRKPEPEQDCKPRDDHEHATTPPPKDAGLTITQFALYAEERLKLGDCTSVRGGDLGVRSTGEASRGSQLIIGSDSFVQPSRLVIAPSVAVGHHVTFGNLRADQLIDDGTVLRTTVPFSPSSMPPLPLAPSVAQNAPDVEVGSDQALALPPGNYGILAIRGVLLLNPGQYAVKRVELGDLGRMVAITGNVRMIVDETLVAGRYTAIAPAFGLSAKHFSISVAGSANNGQPVASIGEHSRLRALVAAPHGGLALADAVRATGALAAYAVTAGAGSRVRFEDGFPAESPGDHGSQQLQGYYGATANPAVAPFVGPVPNDQVIHLAIGLPGQNLPGLKSFAAQVSDPKSPQFRKYLTQNQFYATFGATDADYQALQTWAQTASGFVIRATYPNKLLLSVTGTAAQVEGALHANLVFRKRKDGSNFVAVDREPSLDLSAPILHISGLTDYVLPHHLAVNGTGGGGTSLRAADIRNAYLGVNSQCQSLDGSGQVVGIVGFDVFNKSDVDAYDALQLPPIVDNAQVVATEGGNPLSGSNIEATQDVEMVQAMAPKAQILFFQGSTGITNHLDDIMMAMATSNPPLTVASSSLAFGASDNEELALSEMAAQGVSFFQGSGDNGDVGDPQQTVNNAHLLTQTLVGGTVLSTNPLTAGLPNPAYPPNYYAGESGWSGSGGGVLDGSNQICPFICSPSVPIPDYQVGVNMAANGGSTKFRNYPDVAMLATSMEFYLQGSTTSTWVGTSFSTPLWAGFTALVNQRSSQYSAGLIGFLNPTVYDIGLTRGSVNDLYSNSFNDVTTGSNGRAAVPGYDLVTGWGSPTCQLVSQLATVTPLTLNTPLALIRFTIVTGDDDAGGGLHGSDQTADVMLQDGTSFTETLRNRSEHNWDNGSTHERTFTIPNTVVPPLTQSHGIAGVRINLVQNNPDDSADNWDIADLFVNLLNPGSPQVCQLNLVGNSRLQDGSTGLVRLSKNPGGSGVGPSATFPTGVASGCQ